LHERRNSRHLLKLGAWRTAPTLFPGREGKALGTRLAQLVSDDGYVFLPDADEQQVTQRKTQLLTLTVLLLYCLLKLPLNNKSNLKNFDGF